MSKPFQFASDIGPGAAKIKEEAAELITVLAKWEVCGSLDYFTGENLKQPIEEEIADVYAALDFFLLQGSWDRYAIDRRREEKLERFRAWRLEQQAKEEQAQRAQREAEQQAILKDIEAMIQFVLPSFTLERIAALTREEHQIVQDWIARYLRHRNIRLLDATPPQIAQAQACLSLYAALEMATARPATSSVQPRSGP